LKGKKDYELIDGEQTVPPVTKARLKERADK